LKNPRSEIRIWQVERIKYKMKKGQKGAKNRITMRITMRNTMRIIKLEITSKKEKYGERNPVTNYITI